MAGPVDTFLKLCVGVSLLGAAGSVGYYFAIYLPERDARLDTERRMERAHAEFARQSEEERAKAEKQAAALKAESDRAAVKANYDVCLGVAQANYNGNWALNCKQLSEKNRKGRSDCVATNNATKEQIAWCDKLWPQFDPSHCSLPTLIASDLNSDYDKARDRCLRESNAGLQ